MDFTEQNNYISAFLTKLETYQNTYIGSNPYYFQGLSTHTSVPTSSTSADNLDSKPSTKPTTWTDTGLIDSSCPVSIEVHEYLAPGDKKGYQAVFKVSDGTKKYIRSVGYGIESLSRTQDWSEITKP